METGIHRIELNLSMIPMIMVLHTFLYLDLDSKSKFNLLNKKRKRNETCPVTTTNKECAQRGNSAGVMKNIEKRRKR